MLKNRRPGVAAATLGLLLLLPSDSTQSQDRPNRLVGVRSFAFQLQEIDLDQIAKSHFDLAVIDYSADGSEHSEWSGAEIAGLKNAHKRVLAYFSIGEAEDYRFYWVRRWRRKPPEWLGRVNLNWPGNYKTHYWDPEWQTILLEYLDRIIDQGFDGVYLDIVDAYWYWAHEAHRRFPEQDTADRMIELIELLAEHARVVRGRSDFVVIPQNATAITLEASADLRQRYWDTIDAIGVEDTFFYGRRNEDNDYTPQQDVLKNLELYRQHGIPIFAIEYLSVDNDRGIQQFQRVTERYGLIGYYTIRALDELRIQ